MRASVWRFYITPFLDGGEYGTEIEVTKDVVFNSIGNLQLALDNSDYNIGILRNSNFAITLNNKEGYYSDIDVPESIFRFTRARSLFRLSYASDNNANYAGMIVAGSTVIAAETTIFEGLIDDNAAATNIQDHKLPLTVLGFESLLDNIPVNYSTITNGDTTEVTLYKLLNQTAFTDYVTVDSGNINAGSDQIIDDKTPYENQTVRGAVSDLLLASSSVLYIVDNVLYISPRTAGVTSEKTFYGQAAFLGIENIISIDNIRTGYAKIFNYITWRETPSIIVQDADSVLTYGVKKQELSIGFFTNSGRISTLLAAILAEFKDQKQELVLTTAVDYTTLALQFLDRVTIDYPLMVVPGSIGGALPIYGVTLYGAGTYPKRLSNFSVDPAADYKIINIETNIQNSTIKFKLRKI